MAADLAAVPSLLALAPAMVLTPRLCGGAPWHTRVYASGSKASPARYSDADCSIELTPCGY